MSGTAKLRPKPDCPATTTNPPIRGVGSHKFAWPCKKEGRFEFLESFTVAAIDAALAAQNAVVAAESLGLGTVYIGALRNRPAEVAALVGLPPRAVVAFGLVVGWEDETAPAAIKPRLPQAAVLHHDVYRLEAQREAIAAYDETARSFQAAQGQDAVGWRALLLNRGRSAASLNGRDRLKQVLRALGFALR